MNSQGQALVDELAATIQARVLNGEIATGTRLRQETLAADFGVSRTPVREALRKLQASGLVEVQPHRGIEGLPQEAAVDEGERLLVPAHRRVEEGPVERGALERGQPRELVLVLRAPVLDRVRLGRRPEEGLARHAVGLVEAADVLAVQLVGVGPDAEVRAPGVCRGRQSQLLVVDTQLMTVTPVDQETVVPSNVRSALASGNTIVDGIDIAVAAGQRDDGSAVWHFHAK